MAQKLIIRQLLASLLLLVFTFSITPKKFLHDAIANHKHTIAPSGNEPTLSRAGFMCKYDNLVAESPFTGEIICFDLSPIHLFSVQNDITRYHFHSSDLFFFQLRGPPPTMEHLPQTSAFLSRIC